MMKAENIEVVAIEQMNPHHMDGGDDNPKVEVRFDFEDERYLAYYSDCGRTDKVDWYVALYPPDGMEFNDALYEEWNQSEFKGEGHRGQISKGLREAMTEAVAVAIDTLHEKERLGEYVQ